MLDPNATKVTMLFPTEGNDGRPFSAGAWSWWLDNIVTFGPHHELSARGSWKGIAEHHRCVKIVITEESEVQRLQAFLGDARQVFAQEVMYFEAVRVHFKLI